jgi:hypothetical protein
MSKIWDALKKAELERDPVIAESEDKVVPRILTPKQRAALEALLANATVTEAAAACGVSQKTIERWLKAPTFVAAYHAASRAAFAESILQLKAASREATEILRAALKDGDVGIRVRAAEAIVNAASRLELATAGAQPAKSTKRRA